MTQKLGGRFTFPGTRLSVNRMGYGAMQLAGKGVFGPPRDRAECVAVLRAAIGSGVNHIDTSDYYGPHVTNQIIREALHPYPDDLVLVTKLGARRDDKGAWIAEFSQSFLVSSVEDNLRNLGLEAMDIANLRLEGPDTEVRAPMEVMARLVAQGKLKHIGISTATAAQIAEAETIAPIVCVQNMYNLAHREDDTLIDDLAKRGIPYTPYFPLGGLNPLQSGGLDVVAGRLGATPMQVALAWLLQRSPNILLIPGTSSRAHLAQNLAATGVTLSAEDVAELDGIAAMTDWSPMPRH